MEKCSHATVNRTDMPLDGRTRLWVATVHNTSHTTRENCPLTTAPDDKRTTSGNDGPRELADTGRRLTTVSIGRRTASWRHDIDCWRRTKTSNDTAWRRTSDFAPDGWRQATTWWPKDGWRTTQHDWQRRGSQPNTADDDERLSTHDQRLPALTQLTARNVSAHTRLLTDEQQLTVDGIPRLSSSELTTTTNQQTQLQSMTT